MAEIDGTLGLVLGVSLYPAYYETGPTVVSNTAIGLVLGINSAPQSGAPPSAQVIPGALGMLLGLKAAPVCAIPPPVIIPGTLGLLLGISADLATAGFVQTASPDTAPPPVGIEIPGTLSLILGLHAGLVSNLIEAVEIPGGLGLLLGLSLVEWNEDCETWVLTGNLFNPSAYANYEFNSFAEFRGAYYGAKDDGLYLLEGPDYNGTPIVPGVRIGPINFSTDRQKRLRSLRLGATGDEVQVRIKGEKGEGFFEKEGDRVIISRDLQSHEFLLDIQGFTELSFLEIVPLVLVTK